MNYTKNVVPTLFAYFIVFCITSTITFAQTLEERDNGKAKKSTPSDNFLSFNNDSFDISGVYISNDQNKYYLRQVNDSIWWVGTVDDNSNIISDIFSGVIAEGDHIFGKWINSPLINNTGSGNVIYDLSVSSKNNVTLIKTSLNSEDGSYPVDTLTKYDPDLERPLSLYVSIDNVMINEARSPNSDVLYVGISAKKSDGEPLVSTRYLGVRGDGSNITTSLNLGPFVFDKDDDADNSLKIELLGLNKAGSRTPFTLLSLTDALIQLMDPLYKISSLNHATNLLHSISPGLIPGGCNGLVFADEVDLSYNALRNSTSLTGTYSQEKLYTGTNSPPGCGPLSEYVVTLSITSS